MARTKKIDKGIKYTVVLPEQDLDLLKDLVNGKAIPSVNAAIREAVEEYIVKSRKEIYRKALIDAVNDPEFLSRTNECMDSFKNTDNEVEEMTGEW